MPFWFAAWFGLSAVVVDKLGVWWAGLADLMRGSSGLRVFLVRSYWGARLSRWVLRFVCRLPACFGGLGAMLTFTESLILAQDERWRRA